MSCDLRLKTYPTLQPPYGLFPFFLYWLLIMSCDPLQLVGKEIRDAPSGLVTQNTSYPPSHVTRHNTPQHDSAAGT